MVVMVVVLWLLSFFGGILEGLGRSENFWVGSFEILAILWNLGRLTGSGEKSLDGVGETGVGGGVQWLIF